MKISEQRHTTNKQGASEITLAVLKGTPLDVKQTDCLLESIPNQTHTLSSSAFFIIITIIIVDVIINVIFVSPIINMCIVHPSLLFETRTLVNNGINLIGGINRPLASSHHHHHDMIGSSFE